MGIFPASGVRIYNISKRCKPKRKTLFDRRSWEFPYFFVAGAAKLRYKKWHQIQQREGGGFEVCAQGTPG